VPLTASGFETFPSRTAASITWREPARFVSHATHRVSLCHAAAGLASTAAWELTAMGLPGPLAPTKTAYTSQFFSVSAA